MWLTDRVQGLTKQTGSAKSTRGCYILLWKNLRISLASGTHKCSKKKLTEIAIKLIPGFMHRRAHIKDPAGSPQVIQVQIIGGDNNIKNHWDNKEIYTMLVYVLILKGNSSTHITGKWADGGTCAWWTSKELPETKEDSIVTDCVRRGTWIGRSPMLRWSRHPKYGGSQLG